MTVRTIRNVPHDLLPMIRDITEQLILLRNVKSASDHLKLLGATQNNAFLIEQYLISLDKEAQEHELKRA